jgi:hypothetical protein
MNGGLNHQLGRHVYIRPQTQLSRSYRRRNSKLLVEACTASISNGKSAWRLESCALPPGWGPRMLPEPGPFFRTNPQSGSNPEFSERIDLYSPPEK